MRMKLPLIRSLAVPPARAPILRYGVALLSTVLALIPTLFFSDIAESRLVVFAVAVMVSAWYGGWKPGLAATSFALTVSAYYSFAGDLTPSEYRRAMAHLALFFSVALLICWFNAALRATQESLRRSESNFRSLVMNAPYGLCPCDALGIIQDANPAMVAMFGYDSAADLTGRHLGSLYSDAQQWFQTADYFHARKEFHNLLMVISGYSEFLLERVGPDLRLRGPAQEISNATQRATSLTRQLLAFSRNKMLARMIGEDIDLVMVPGPAIGAVRADPGQIDQVIMNLAVNARDAMPQGGKLTIETANVALDEHFARTHSPLTAGNYIMLAISDTGVGMDNETQSRIFEPFFTTKGAKGTGLGLSMVHGIVKQSGGFFFCCRP